MDATNDDDNLELFRECLSAILIEKLSQDAGKKSKKPRSKGRKNSIQHSTASIVDGKNENGNDPAELSDFIEVARCTMSSHINLLTSAVFGGRNLSKCSTGFAHDLIRHSKRQPKDR